MKKPVISYRPYWLVILSLAVILSPFTSPSFAGTDSHHEDHEHKNTRLNGGDVLPPVTESQRYSLYDIAKATANFNVSDRSGNVPNTPFKILYTSTDNPTNTFEVNHHTVLYVPILYNDDSLPVIGHLPSVKHREALLKYFYSQKEFGMLYTTIKVDGKETSLGSDYVVGVHFHEPLKDGAKNYMTSATFLSPFKKGKHTVEISFKATGAAFSDPVIKPYFPSGIFEATTVYTVNVH
jgi:hypothetical protein